LDFFGFSEFGSVGFSGLGFCWFVQDWMSVSQDWMSVCSLDLDLGFSRTWMLGISLDWIRWFLSDLDAWNFFGLDFCVAFLRSWIGFFRIRIRRIFVDLDFVRC